jgi:hypothetical protein
MTLAEKVFHELEILPEPYQAEVLDFVEFLRSRVKKRSDPSEALRTMYATEAVLSRDWDSPEEDAAWSDL